MSLQINQLFSSMDKLATPDAESYNSLIALHPKSPVDRRSAPNGSASASLQVSSVDIRRAISSFPNRSAGGPAGIRPQHLKDLLLGRTDDDPLLLAITDLINALLDGKVRAHVRPIIFGGILLAISKKGGGVRPIAVGYVWRRLAAKIACKHIMDRGAALLAPCQLGFGVRGGVEAAVHAASRFIANLQPGKLFL